MAGHPSSLHHREPRPRSQPHAALSAPALVGQWGHRTSPAHGRRNLQLHGVAIAPNGHLATRALLAGATRSLHRRELLDLRVCLYIRPCLVGLPCPPFEPHPLARLQHLPQGIRADRREVLLVCVIHGARRDALLSRPHLRRPQQVDHRIGRPPGEVGRLALGAQPLLAVPKCEAGVEEDQLQPLLEPEAAESLVERVRESVEPFGRCGGEFRRDEQNGRERALVRLPKLQHLLPEGLVELLDGGRACQRVRHTARRQPGALYRGGEGAHLHLDDHCVHPLVSLGQHLLIRHRRRRRRRLRGQASLESGKRVDPAEELIVKGVIHVQVGGAVVAAEEQRWVRWRSIASHRGMPRGAQHILAQHLGQL
mmetsp:Transcript_8947/g.29617  ORF Transcript_8947/g.29617 Transcript_8947/m.29617 type:complete len:367 (-) Transcript_8947:413-1513(-)